MKQELVLSVGDIRSVVLPCPHCGTQVLFDTQKGLPPVENQPQHQLRANCLPEACPACQKSFDTGVRAATLSILTAFKDLREKQIADQVVFRISTPAEDQAA